MENQTRFCAIHSRNFPKEYRESIQGMMDSFLGQPTFETVLSFICSVGIHNVENRIKQGEVFRLDPIKGKNLRINGKKNGKVALKIESDINSKAAPASRSLYLCQKYPKFPQA